METVIDDPKSFFERLGGLHDARITALDWTRDGNVLRLSINDLNINSRGYPDYEGEKPARLELRGIEAAEIAMDNDLREKGIWIFDLEAAPRAGTPGYDLRITTSPGGRIAITCREILIDSS